MSASSTDRGLLTPQNCGVVFTVHQPKMFLDVAGVDRHCRWPSAGAAFENNLPSTNYDSDVVRANEMQVWFLAEHVVDNRHAIIE